MPARTTVRSKASMASLAPLLAALLRRSVRYAAVSRVVCDGKGVCHGEGTRSFNGVIVPLVDMVANYTVNPDCTGSITVNLGAGEIIRFNFVIVDRGKELRSIQTDPNVVITGNLRQQ